MSAVPACDESDPRITAYGMLLEAHAAVVHAVGKELERTSGMPTSWFEVLIRLVRSPGEQLRMSDLAAQVQLSTSGLTRLVDRLEAAGLVERQPCPGDRRGFNAVLTDTGRDALRRALPDHLDAIDRFVVQPLGGDIETITDLLRKLRDNAGPCPGPLPCR